MSPYLPVELWLYIGCFLSAGDICRLSEVSKGFTCILRPLFYDRVTLTQTKDTTATDHPKPAEATLDLLARNQELAAYVKELTLNGGAYPRRSQSCGLSLINIQAMKNMTMLKRMKLHGNVLRYVHAEPGEKRRVAVRNAKNEFFEVLAGMKDLEVIEVWDLPELRRKQLMKLSGLKEVYWIGKNETQEIKGLRALLSASFSTIRILDILLNSFKARTHSILFTLRFPQLRCLTLRETAAGEQLGRLFGTFLVAHPALVYLNLGQYFGCMPCLTLTTDALQVFQANRNTTLPNLGFFCGHFASFKVMVLADLPCLYSTLHTLDLEPSGIRNDDSESVIKLIDLLGAVIHHRKPGWFAPLRNLGISLGTRRTISEPLLCVLPTISMAMKDINAFKSPIEVWKQAFPYVDAPVEKIGRIFGRFENIRIINMDQRYLSVVEDPNLGWIEKFVKEVPTLEEMWFGIGENARQGWKVIIIGNKSQSR